MDSEDDFEKIIDIYQKEVNKQQKAITYYSDSGTITHIDSLESLDNLSVGDGFSILELFICSSKYFGLSTNTARGHIIAVYDDIILLFEDIINKFKDQNVTIIIGPYHMNNLLIDKDQLKYQIFNSYEDNTIFGPYEFFRDLYELYMNKVI